MTALNRYQRLETTGLWRETPGAQRRDVGVAIGDATLVISDPQGTALTHWSLPAIVRRNGHETPALYAPGADAEETLELDDPEMVSAIETVQAALARRGPHHGRLRGALLATAMGALALGAVFWLPSALVTHTATVVPEVKRAEIGAALLNRITRVAGQPCASRLGTPALARLDRRLGGDGTSVQVLPGGIQTAAHLPGGLVLLNRALVEDFEGPEVAAGHVLTERLRAEVEDPLVRFLEATGVRTVIQLLTTGAVPDAILDDYAETMVMTDAVPIEDELILASFRAAGVPSTPYAYAIDLSGESTFTLIEADPVAPTMQAPLLADEDWVSLQSICGG